MSSFSSTSRSITFTKKSGNFMAFISCDTGDVYVDFKKEDSTDNGNYSPLFSNDNPRILELNISNSMGIRFTVRSVKWLINGDDLSDPSKGLSPFYEKIGDTQLKIKGAIAAKSGNQSITIVAEAMLDYNTSDTATIRATYHIPVRQTSGDVWHVTIAACDDAANYTINTVDGGIDVKCLVFDPTGAAQDPSKFKYVWSKWNHTDWQEFGNAENTRQNQLHINRGDVDNQAMFKVEVFAQKQGGGYEDNPLGMDTQMIYDAMDEYFIEVINSRDENLEQGSGDQIDYCIAIVNATLGCRASKAKVSFYLHAYGAIPAKDYVTDLNWDNSHTGPADGNPLTYGPDVPMFSVTEQDFLNNGCTALTLDICAQILD